MMPPPRSSRYDSWGWEFADTIICLLMFPFLLTISYGASCYCLTTFDSTSFPYLFVRFAVVGPVLFLLAIVFSPFVIVGYCLWVILNNYASIQPFYYISPMSQHPSAVEEGSQCASKFTFCSANVLLCPEIIGRFNNARNVNWRMQEIPRRLLQQDPLLNDIRNLQPPVQRENVIHSKLPDVDVIILQEVLERSCGKQLAKYLESKYPYCIYDVSVHSVKTNMCFCGSGLFLASRYPVLEATFHPFTYKTHYGKLVCYGMLLTKLDLGMLTENNQALRAVGYISNIHTQAYQGKVQVVRHQLEEVRLRLKSFIENTHSPEKETVVFSVIGGDFNCDNISPGDASTQDLPLWDEYEDPCREYAGADKPWTVGTEHRQRFLHSPLLQDPEAFRKVLLDDVQRRLFMLDADVKEQTMELMWVAPKPDSSGMVQAIKEGGRRRIDYLLLRNDDLVFPAAFWFSTVTGGLSDHIPVVLMVERKPC